MMARISLLRMGIMNATAYPQNLLSGAALLTIFLYVFNELWMAVARFKGVEVLGNFSTGTIVWYFYAAEVILLSRSTMSDKIASTVKDGTIGHSFIRPTGHFAYNIFICLGEMLPRMITNGFVGFIVAFAITGMRPELSSLTMFIILAILVQVLDLTISYFIGLFAFLMEEVVALEWIYSKLLLLFGGGLIPLIFFPEFAQQYLRLLPFTYIISSPSLVLVNKSDIPLNEIIFLILGWTLIFTICGQILFKIMRSRLQINGG